MLIDLIVSSRDPRIDRLRFVYVIRDQRAPDFVVVPINMYDLGVSS